MNKKTRNQIFVAVGGAIILNLLTAFCTFYTNSTETGFESKENTKDIQELKIQCDKKADKSMIFNIEDKWDKRFTRLEDKIDNIYKKL
jgi:hypothetical protein